MTDFNELVRAAMVKGQSVEDIVANFTAEVQELKKQEKQKREQEEAKKYSVYTKPIANSYASGYTAMDKLFSCTKVSPHDMAIAFAHFMCQNVPGYAEALGKSNTDPVVLYENMLDDQVKVAKIVAEHKDSSDGDRIAALINHLLDETFKDFSKDCSSCNKNASSEATNTKSASNKIKSSKHSWDLFATPDIAIKFALSESDIKAIDTFMKNHSLI